MPVNFLRISLRLNQQKKLDRIFFWNSSTEAPTNLIIEGEPGDVDGAWGLEDAWGDVGAEACASNHHIGLVGRVKGLRCWFINVHQDDNDGEYE